MSVVFSRPTVMNAMPMPFRSEADDLSGPRRGRLPNQGKPPVMTCPRGRARPPSTFEGGGELPAGGDAEFPEHLAEVVLDGRRGHEQAGGDLRVGHAGRGPAGGLRLPARHG